MVYDNLDDSNVDGDAFMCLVETLADVLELSSDEVSIVNIGSVSRRLGISRFLVSMQRSRIVYSIKLLLEHLGITVDDGVQLAESMQVNILESIRNGTYISQLASNAITFDVVSIFQNTSVNASDVSFTSVSVNYAVSPEPTPAPTPSESLLDMLTFEMYIGGGILLCLIVVSFYFVCCYRKKRRIVIGINFDS